MLKILPELPYSSSLVRFFSCAFDFEIVSKAICDPKNCSETANEMYMVYRFRYSRILYVSIQYYVNCKTAETPPAYVCKVRAQGSTGITVFGLIVFC